MDFVRQQIDDTLVELCDKLRNMSPLEKAGFAISCYCKIDNPGLLTTAKFEEWLQKNAYLALQTDVLQLYFDKFSDGQALDESAERKKARALLRSIDGAGARNLANLN